MKKNKIFAGILIFAAIVAAHLYFDTGSADALTCLGAGSGGTGICNATSSNIGQVIEVSGILTVGSTSIPVYTFANASGTSGGGGTTTINGFSGSIFYLIPGAGITSTVANGTTTFILNLSGTACAGNNFLQGVTATGTGTCATPSGGASSTNVFGVNGVHVTQVGINATASLDTTYAALWTALETFQNGVTINGTTTIASTTNAIAVTDPNGKIFGFAGSNPCVNGQAAISISATGTIGCTAVVTSTTGNWAGTWQGVNSTTFYLASNPSAFISNISTTINTASPLGGGGSFVNGSTLNLTCTTCLTANQSITVTATGEATGTGSGTTSITLPLVLKSPVTENVSTTQVTSTQFSQSGIGSAIVLATGGNFGAYGGASACSAGNAVTTISATGGTTCSPFLTTSTFNLTGTPWNITGWNNAGTSLLPTSTMYMQSSTGNIGIFTTNPASRLTVAQSSTGDEAEGLLIDGSLNGATSNADIELNAASSSATEANVDFTKGGVDQWQIGIQNNGTNDFELWDGSNNPAFTINHSSLDAAFGTSTASAELTIQNEAGSASPTFNVLNASGTTQLNVSNNGDVSIGTSSDKGLLGVVNASGTTVFKIATTTNPTSSFVALNVLGNPSTTATITPISVLQVLASGHINATGTLPTMGTCGSSPSVVGTDSMGTITVGSGVVTSCTMNFQIPYETSNLFGLESDNSTAVTGDISALTTSSVTFSFSATLGGGKLYYFIGENQ